MSRAALSETQRQALREIRAALPDATIALIGAGALAHHVPLARDTEDIDLVVALDIPTFADAAKPLGWRRHATLGHEWMTEAGDSIDVLPVDAEALRIGKLVWPGGFEMNLTGIRHALGAPWRDLGGVSVRLPTVAAIALLKMVSYLDRPAERMRDLKDLATILDGHPETDDDAFFEDDVLAEGLAEHEARAWILGRDLDAIPNAEERAIVWNFLTRMLADGVDTARFVANSPWKFRPEEALARLRIVAARIGK